MSMLLTPKAWRARGANLINPCTSCTTQLLLFRCLDFSAGWEFSPVCWPVTISNQLINLWKQWWICAGYLCVGLECKSLVCLRSRWQRYAVISFSAALVCCTFTFYSCGFNIAARNQVISSETRSNKVYIDCHVCFLLPSHFLQKNPYFIILTRFQIIFMGLSDALIFKLGDQSAKASF